MIYNSHALLYHIYIYIYLYMYFIIIYYIVWCTLLFCVLRTYYCLLLGSTRRRATWRRRSAAKNKDKRKVNITTRRSDALKPSREIVTKIATHFPSVRLLSRYCTCSNTVIIDGWKLQSHAQRRVFGFIVVIIWRFNDDGLVVARVTYLYLRVKKKRQVKIIIIITIIIMVQRGKYWCSVGTYLRTITLVL